MTNTPNPGTMRWVDVAVTNKEAFIVNCDEGFREFVESIWWEDNFQIDAPTPLPTGVYRWQQFKVGFWGEDEGMNVTGGEFVPFSLSAIPTPDLIARLELWFFRDISNEQRRSFIELALGKSIADEARPHAWQRLCFRRIMKDLSAADSLQAHASPRELRLEKALKRISGENGHCSECGEPCEGCLTCDCRHASWVQDDPVELARTALELG